MKKESRVSFSVRLKLTDLATGARWLSESGVPFKNMSDLTHILITSLAENLESQEQVRYDDVDQALNYLQTMGMNIGPGDSRKGKGINKALQLEALNPAQALVQKKEILNSFIALQEQLGMKNTASMDELEALEPTPDFSSPKLEGGKE